MAPCLHAHRPAHACTSMHQPTEPSINLAQIFDELRKVGRRHDLSAGLLIGGKDVREEQSRVHGEDAAAVEQGRWGDGSSQQRCPPAPPAAGRATLPAPAAAHGTLSLSHWLQA